MVLYLFVFFFQAEDGIRDLVRSRGLGDVYKRQGKVYFDIRNYEKLRKLFGELLREVQRIKSQGDYTCLLYTSDAADERSSVDLGGRRIIKNKTKKKHRTESSRITVNRRLVHKKK